MKQLILLFIATLTLLQVNANEADSLKDGHRTLKALEVVGVKQMPVSDLAAVTRISGGAIKRYNVVALRDISEMAPNFYMPEYGSRMTSSIYVRGLGARMDQPIIGLSVDNVPVMNKDAYDFDVADIESIEVLRGAQSLLNGRNTMGGQVNIRTLSPLNYSGLRAMLSYGRNNAIRASVGWYHRFSETFGTSVSAMYDMNDGYFRNAYNGNKIDRDRSGSVRWKLCWRPKSWVSLTNTASGSITRQGGYPYESLKSGVIAYNDTCFYHRSTFSDGLTVAWAGKRVVVTSITTAQYIDDNMTLDQDFLPDDYFTLTQKRKEWSFTEDLFTKGSRGNYDWLGGVFCFSKSGQMDAPVHFYDTGISQLIESHRNEMNPHYPIKWDGRDFVLGSDFRQTSRGLALYHESIYKYNKWTFQAGLRWDCEWVGLKHHSHCDTGYETYEKQEDGSLKPYGHTPLKINDRGSLSNNYMELLPKIAVAYDLADIKLYGTISKAYKSGGYNTQMFSDVLQQRIMQYMGLSMTYDLDEVVSYKPEKSWNYEAGVKTSWFNGRLMADLALFFIDCRDQQLTMFPPGLTTGRIMTNAGQTYSKGVELSAILHATNSLTFRTSYGYTNATFRKFSDSKGDYRGKRLPYAPAQTFFAGVNWIMPFEIAGASPSINLNVRGAGDIYWNEANTVKQPFYALLGASAAIEKDAWSLRIWGENLTSTRYSTFYFMSIGNEFVQRARPWQAGVTLRVNVEM
ncbi:MAG: TonB-dependent receptor [Muribaculaceae bacterium]|nr:TonB-dependent receptor [Muribaculaceae bacterium]